MTDPRATTADPGRVDDIASMRGGLLAVAGQIKRWLEWDRKHRENNRPPLTTEDGTHIMALPVPFWPSHGQFERWIKLFEDAAQSVDSPAPLPHCGEPVAANPIPWKDDARQFPLYELAPDFTLFDRDPQADERLKLYRDIFAEISAKAVPVSDPDSSDPDRVRYYRIPVGPLHRAAGKLGFQLFDGERHLANAIKEIARLKAAQPNREAVAREALAKIVELDQHESKITVECDPAGNTYEIRSLDGPCAAIARAALSPASSHGGGE